MRRHTQGLGNVVNQVANTIHTDGPPRRRRTAMSTTSIPPPLQCISANTPLAPTRVSGRAIVNSIWRKLTGGRIFAPRAMANRTERSSRRRILPHPQTPHLLLPFLKHPALNLVIRSARPSVMVDSLSHAQSMAQWPVQMSPSSNRQAKTVG